MMTSRGYYSSPIANSSNSSDCCSNRSNGSASVSASAELKIYRAFIFSVPIFFTFILLFLFYIFYLRPRRVDWSSLRMRALSLPHNNTISTDSRRPCNVRVPFSRNDCVVRDEWCRHIYTIRPEPHNKSDMGLKKELREMLPIIVYKESFSVKDTQCAVCLLEYQADDKLQQIPACGHTFHMSCIDLWLANHSTCPLCRLSLLTFSTSSTETSNIQMSQSNEETQATELSESRSTRPLETTVSGEVATNAHCIDVEGQNALNNQ